MDPLQMALAPQRVVYLNLPLMEEGVPENLGCEWRVLHPFEIPRVRFPTDNTPPN